MRLDKLVFVPVTIVLLVGLLSVVGCTLKSFGPKTGQVYEFTVEELQAFLKLDPNSGYQPRVVFELEKPRQTWSNARIDLLVGGVDGDFVEVSFRGFVEKRSVVRLSNGQYFACGGNVKTWGLPRWDELFDSCIEVNPEGKALDAYYRYEWAPPAVVFPKVGQIINLTHVEPTSDPIVGYPQDCQQVRIILSVPLEIFRGRTPFFDPRG